MIPLRRAFRVRATGAVKRRRLTDFSIRRVRTNAGWAGNPFWVRRETGKEQVVQVHYSEGVANHIGLKPCGVPREGGAEASVEERAGQPLSHDRVFIPDADVLQYAEGHTQRRVSASASAIRRGRRPWHVRTFLAREPGDLQADRRWWDTPAARIGKARSRSQ